MKKIMFIVMIMSLVLPVMAFAGGNATATAGSTAGSYSGGNSQSYSSPSIPMQPQPLYPYLLQMVPGSAGRMTDNDVPEFDAIQRLRYKKVLVNQATGEERIIQQADRVIKVEYYTRGGRIAGFSRYEDWDQDLVALVPKAMKLFGQSDTSNIRFDVFFKSSQKSIGTSGGAGMSQGSFNGATAIGASGAVVPGVAVNTFDPKIIIKFYLVASPQANYERDGWKRAK